MKIRIHRGTLAESMETAKDIEPTVAAVADYFMAEAGCALSDSLTVMVVPYGGVDERTGWDTHMVTLCMQNRYLEECVVGVMFTDQTFDFRA